MNKRQKKKKEKRIAWDSEKLMKKEQQRLERYGYRYNYEGYRDDTAAAAIEHLTRQGY